MANKHYGKIGDIWKHLPLADVLSIEQPTQYWESHAGSAQYELSHSDQRDYGVFHFLENAHQNDILADSAYFWLSSALVQSESPMVPGSPGIAMATLNPEDTRFLFCDTDQLSLDSIEQTARELDGPSHSVKTLCADGLSQMRGHLKNMTFTQASETFLFIDPYALLKSDENGLTALDLFCQAAFKGVKTMLWFGTGSRYEHTEILEHLHQAIMMYRLDLEEHLLWLGHMHLSHKADVGKGFNPGVWGCAILCANLSHESLATCAHLGRALEQIYSSARFPDKSSGRLSFSQTMFRREARPSKAVPILNSVVFERPSCLRNPLNRHTESLT